jgi:hypothetical protein
MTARREGARLKISTFTVRASRDEATRWEAIAKHQGHRTVGHWLAKLAENESRRVGELVPRNPLVWRRGRFKATAPDPRFAPATVEREVYGWVAGPFGIYRQAGKPRFFVLVHVPSKVNLCHLRRGLDCREIARQLSALPFINWNKVEPERVADEGKRAAEAILDVSRRKT